ncbi:MAG: hypothetical protein HOC71_09740 [Candidatus Latescibacteria bacterium]|nr:hypothetical protein [Candidatus Latescibacterota bacterium]
MTINTSNSLDHWNYFLALDEDLIKLSRYVEFCESNFECHSLEMARILFTAASEVDVVSKQLCQKLDSHSEADGINQYRDIIKNTYSNVPDFKVTIPRFGLNLTPWSNWNQNDGVPLWWTANNKVKHHRNTDFYKANLKNVINAVSGLFVITLYFYKEKAENAELIPMQSLLRVTEENFDGMTFDDDEFGINYKL